jgi:hypothetical protein
MGTFLVLPGSGRFEFSVPLVRPRLMTVMRDVTTVKKVAGKRVWWKRGISEKMPRLVGKILDLARVRTSHQHAVVFHRIITGA